MDAKKLKAIIMMGESTTVQFKERVDDSYKIGCEFVAFSNSQGGLLVVGVNDKTGEVTGLSYEEIQKTSNLLSNAASDNVSPSITIMIETVVLDGKTVVAARVAQGLDKPYKDNKGIVWIKNGSDKRKVFSNERLRILMQSCGRLFADRDSVPESSFEDISLPTLKQFLIEKYRNNLADDFAAYLKEVSGQEYEFAPNTKGDNILFCIMNGVRIPFQWVASTGTRNLELQYYWLKEMDNASFVFIYEFDAFYHHELSYKICKRLFEGNNQVFVTTHDTFLLSNDLLRPDCFFILRNNEIKAICDLTDKELRFAHNLEKLYRGGTFGL